MRKKDIKPHELVKLITHVSILAVPQMKKLWSLFPIKSKAEGWNRKKKPHKNYVQKNEGENWNKK
jgi:hypothetical protein